MCKFLCSFTRLTYYQLFLHQLAHGPNFRLLIALNLALMDFSSPQRHSENLINRYLLFKFSCWTGQRCELGRTSYGDGDVVRYWQTGERVDLSQQGLCPEGPKSNIGFTSHCHPCIMSPLIRCCTIPRDIWASTFSPYELNPLEILTTILLLTADKRTDLQAR